MKSLREHRVERMLSQRELARRAGVTPRTLLFIELGRRHPTYRTISKLSAALRVAPEAVAEFSLSLHAKGSTYRAAA